MRLSCLSKASLLAVIVCALGGGDCALAELGECRSGRKAIKDGSHSFGNDRRAFQSNQPPYNEHIETVVKGMSEDWEDSIELDNARLPDMDGPEVLRMNRETFNALDEDVKIKLTKDLTAKEWNELLANFWVGGETKFSILYYTLKYGMERRLEMLEEALTEDLPRLFAGMCSLAYVPRTPKVIKILERGVKVYSYLRHWIARTMYQLEYPATNWHLNHANEDVRVLKDLIEAGSIKREAIVGHLAEIVTLYPLDVLGSLLIKGILTMKDVCTMESYCEVCGLGGKRYLKWATETCGLRPDQKCINAAVSNGHENVVDFIANELGMTMVPSQEAVNQAAANGMLSLLSNKCHGWGLFPNTDGANQAVNKGHLDVLKWLGAVQQVYPSQYGVNQAAWEGHLDMLIWLAAARQIYPNETGANWAAYNGQLDVLIWLAAERQTYPSQYGANDAAKKGHLDVLKWLAGERKVYPDQAGANQAAKNGQLDVLQWLSTPAGERQVYPDQAGANGAARKGHLDVLKWLATERGVYPDNVSARKAACKGYPGIIEWLRKQESVANCSNACEAGLTKIEQY